MLALNYILLFLQELPKLRINLGKGNDDATVTTINHAISRNPGRKTRQNTINNNNKLKSNIQKKSNRRSNNLISDDETTEEEFSSSEHESE